MPAIVIIGLIIVYPFISSLRLAFFERNLLKPLEGTFFVGLDNFASLFGERETFWVSLMNSIVLTGGTVVGATLVGLVIALLLNKRFRGIGLVRSVFVLPWVVPNVVAAVIWVWILNYQFGSVNSILMKLGILGQRIAWFGDKRYAMSAAIAANIWKQVPFVLLVLLAGLQSIPNEMREAAKVDGVSVLQEFWYIVLPNLWPYIALTVILRTIWTFNLFEYVYLLTSGGGPGIATRTLPIEVYFTAFQEFRFGRASAIAFIMSIILIVCINFFMQQQKRVD
jgi:multiple sugar transport system permease protein